MTDKKPAAKKLKDQIKVGDRFFIVSGEPRINANYQKYMIVKSVGNKHFVMGNEEGYQETKFELSGPYQQEKGIVALEVTNFGSKLMAYKDEETYRHEREIKKMSVALNGFNFVEQLPKDVQDEMLDLLKDYI